MIDPQHQRQFDQLRDTPPPGGLADRIAAALPAEVGAVQPLPGITVRMLITFGILGTVAVALGFLKGGSGWKVLQPEQRWLLVLLLASTGAWLAFELSVRMVPGARIRVASPLPGLVAFGLTLAWTLTFMGSNASAPWFYLPCWVYAAVGVLSSAFSTSFWLRRGFRCTPTKWLAAGAFGLAGFAAVQLFCPYLDGAHILTSHTLPALLVGAAAGYVHARGAAAT